MDRLAKRHGWRIQSFVLVPWWDHPPFYRLYVEPTRLGPDRCQADLGPLLDEELQALNIEYHSKRKTARLGCVQVQFVPGGTLAELDRRIRNRNRPGANEQYKHQYLYTSPQQVEELQTVVQAHAVAGDADR